MTSYQVREAGTIKLGLKNRLLSALAFTVIAFALRFGWMLFAPSGFERRSGTTGSALEIAIWAIALGFTMAFLQAKPRVPGYRMIVEDNSITGITQYTGYMKWFVSRKTVRRGRVRTIFEVPPTRYHSGGIGVSEHSRFGTRMWGFVYIPSSLPEFDQLKALAESWRSIE